MTDKKQSKTKAVTFSGLEANTTYRVAHESGTVEVQTDESGHYEAKNPAEVDALGHLGAKRKG
jgi:hypothetical protein